MNFCILHQHLYQADGFQIPPQTQMLQRYAKPVLMQSQIIYRISLSIVIAFSMFFISCNGEEAKDKEYKIENTTASNSPQDNHNDDVVSIDTSSIAISAQELVSEYIANEVAADSKYKGKNLIVEGEIIDIKKGVSGVTFIVLRGSQGNRQVQCYYNNINDIKSLKTGERVYMKGICDGLWVNVILNNCIRIREFEK